MKRHLLTAALLLGLSAPLACPPPAYAVEPSEVLPDPAMEARAREISKDLRCLVCQNQSIDDSNADLARDLRRLVRERLVAGDGNDQVKSYLVDRYGDYVLLRPPFKATTLLLWAGPFALLAVGAVALAVYLRRRQGPGGADTAPLTEDERRRLDALLKDQG